MNTVAYALEQFISIFNDVYNIIKDIFVSLDVWNFLIIVIIIGIIIEYIVESGGDDDD